MAQLAPRIASRAPPIRGPRDGKDALAWQQRPVVLLEDPITAIEDRSDLREVEAEVLEHVRVLASLSREQEREFPAAEQRLLEEVEPSHVFDLPARGICEALSGLGELLTKILRGGCHDRETKRPVAQVGIHRVREVF